MITLHDPVFSTQKGAMKPIPTHDCHILLVEDNDFDATTFCKAIKTNRPHCSVTVVERGEDALSRVLDDPNFFSVAIIDNSLPGLSGLDLCRIFIEKGIALPLVILTGGGSERLAVEALKLGIADYIAKDSHYEYIELIPLILDDVLRRFAREQSLKAAEEARKTAEARYKAVVEDHLDAICRFNSDGCITFFNEACRQFLCEEKATCTLNFFDSMPLSEKKLIYTIETITKDSPSATLEVETTKQGRPRWFQWKIRGLFDSNGAIHEYQAVGRDVTDIKNAHNKLIIVNDLLAKQNSKLKEMALTDQLTGVANRRNLYTFAEEQWSRAVRKNEEFSITLLDIDHFKNINDTYGHLTGDKVLSRLGQLLDGSIRGYDRVGRWGGEEFMIVLPATIFQDALLFAERIRDIIEKEELVIDDGRKISFTVSLGVAGRLPQGLSRLEKLFQQADEALYQAKQNGRNRVYAYSE